MSTNLSEEEKRIVDVIAKLEAELAAANCQIATRDVLLRDSKEIVERVTGERDGLSKAIDGMRTKLAELETTIHARDATVASMRIQRDEAVALLGELLEAFDSIMLETQPHIQRTEKYDTTCALCDARYCSDLNFRQDVKQAYPLKPRGGNCTNPACPAVKARALIERIGGAK